MKNLICTLTILTFLGLTSLYGQSHLGITGGLNFAQWKFSEASEYPISNYQGKSIGLISRRFVTEQVAMVTTLQYIEKGTTFSVSDYDFETVDVNAVLKYFEGGFKLRYYTSYGSTRFFLGGGVTYGTMLSGELVALGESAEDLTEMLDSNEWGYVLSAGLEFNEKFFVEAGYSGSFGSILASNVNEIQNSGIQLTAGLYF